MKIIKVIFWLISFVLKNRKAIKDIYEWVEYSGGDGVTLKFEDDDEQPENGTNYRVVVSSVLNITPEEQEDIEDVTLEERLEERLGDIEDVTLEELEALDASFVIIDRHDLVSEWLYGVDRVFFSFKSKRKYKTRFSEKLRLLEFSEMQALWKNRE